MTVEFVAETVIHKQSGAGCDNPPGSTQPFARKNVTLRRCSALSGLGVSTFVETSSFVASTHGGQLSRSASPGIGCSKHLLQDIARIH